VKNKRLEGDFVGDFFRNLGSKYEAFWIGRNGSDSLGITSLVIAVILLVINSFVNNLFLMLLVWVFLIYSIFRSTSKNIAARQAEQEKFDSFKERIFNKKSQSKNKSNAQKNSYGSAKQPRKSYSGFSKKKNKAASDKLVFNCESCGQSLSVPRNRGTLKVTCPKCGKTTTIKS
jgi:predicted RNA-binding Zn-ribbon protein involved in translation (DUF1610 family)